MAKNLVAKTGEYQKGGETKGSYTRIGVMLESENGEYILLDPAVNLSGCLQKQNMLNVGNGREARDMLMVSLFSDEPKESKAPSKPSKETYIEDVPF